MFTTGGSHQITLAYSGDANFNGSTSAVFAQFVGQANSSVSVAAAPTSSTYGQKSVTLTATVTGAGATPTGSVTFVDGTTPMWMRERLDGTGKATFSTAALTPGDHTSIYVELRG